MFATDAPIENTISILPVYTAMTNVVEDGDRAPTNDSEEIAMEDFRTLHDTCSYEGHPISPELENISTQSCSSALSMTSIGVTGGSCVPSSPVVTPATKELAVTVQPESPSIVRTIEDL